MNKQTKEELQVFSKFTKVAPLGKVDFWKREKPEPDILCELVNNEFVAFELTRIVDPALVKGIVWPGEAKRMLEDYFGKLPAHEHSAFKNKFGDAHLYFKFRQGAKQKARKKILHDVFQRLGCLTPGFEGKALKNETALTI